MDFVQLASDIASKENFKGLEILFTRHGDRLLPFRLSILDSIPIFSDPSAYKSLLPRINPVTKCVVQWPVVNCVLLSCSFLGANQIGSSPKLPKILSN